MTCDTNRKLEDVPPPVPAAFDLLAVGLLGMAQRARDAQEKQRQLMKVDDDETEDASKAKQAQN